MTIAGLLVLAAVIVAMVNDAREAELDRKYRRMRRTLRHSLGRRP